MKRPLGELVQSVEITRPAAEHVPTSMYRPVHAAPSHVEPSPSHLLEEVHKLEVLLHDYESHKRSMEKQSRENKSMLYMILITNLAIFAFIIGAMIRFFLK